MNANDYVNHPDLRILGVLAGLCGYHRKAYCYPSQETIVRLTQTHSGRAISRRSLNRHLGALELAGWIRRMRRHKRGRSGMLELHSTLYQLTRQALRWLNGAASFLRNSGPQNRAVPGISAVPSMAQHDIPNENNSPGSPLRREAAGHLRAPQAVKGNEKTPTAPLITNIGTAALKLMHTMTTKRHT